MLSKLRVIVYSSIVLELLKLVGLSSVYIFVLSGKCGATDLNFVWHSFLATYRAGGLLVMPAAQQVVYCRIGLHHISGVCGHLYRMLTCSNPRPLLPLCASYLPVELHVRTYLAQPFHRVSPVSRRYIIVGVLSVRLAEGPA